MAKSTKKTTKKKAPSKIVSDTKVTRITASDSGSKKPSSKSAPAKVHKLSSKEKADVTENKGLKALKLKLRRSVKSEQEQEEKAGGRRRPLRAISQYFRGAWYELRQVRWPDRSNTLQMTGALIGFTVFIATLILLLDALFKYLFQLMIGA